MDILNNSIDKLNLKKYSDHPQLQKVSKVLKVPVEYLILGVIALIPLLLILTHCGRVSLNIILVYLYPAYKTFKAREGNDVIERRRWLVYWTIFGFIFSLQTCLSYFIDFSIHNLLLTLILVAVYSALVDGYAMIYDSIMKPLLQKHQNVIDKVIQLAKDETKDIVKRTANKAVNEMTK